ncbi:hypothetical protein GCM10009557_74970 [Virgisporangium ochraceum]|uniref:Uncharacterized protein n=2 Tax=Virgisporangium ochraceum TaxID=65505 RepID=A0A8J4EFW7_9ACTN|nr:hypothetical protein Voc01_080680 [Virgisporangium ochraceum]
MQRAIAMVGLTLMTGGMLGVTATAASAAPTQEKATQSVERHRDHDGDRDRWRHRDRRVFKGIYPSERMCRFIGRTGDWEGRWDDPECVQVGRRAWALWVEPDNDRRWRGHR